MERAGVAWHARGVNMDLVHQQPKPEARARLHQLLPLIQVHIPAWRDAAIRTRAALG